MKVAASEVMPQTRSWASIEKLVVDNDHLRQRPFHPRSLHRQPKIVQAFGSAGPSSKTLLLHRYAAPESELGNPLILVHGANRNAEYFLDPHEDGSFRDSLPETLRQAGRQVYAVSFAHNQDDNWWWCEALNEAILAVSARHADKPCDLLGHSKGGVAVRLAATDWRPDPGCQRFLGPLISRVLLLGTPNGGVDFFYRYPSVNLAFASFGDEPIFNWPTSWHQICLGGQWTDLPISYLGEFYPGQAQILGRWREEYPLAGLDPDEEMTYEGGQTARGRSLGIDHAMAASSRLIEELRRRPTDPGIAVALLAAASPTIPGVTNDTSGPSDGIVYVKSALEFPEGARLVAAQALPVHHKALIAEPLAQQAILAALQASAQLSPAQLRAGREEGLVLGEQLRQRTLGETARAVRA